MTGIDIPVGKALVAVEVSDENKCEGCIYLPCRHENHCDLQSKIPCGRGRIVYRKDGKNVIFKLVDWLGEVK